MAKRRGSASSPAGAPPTRAALPQDVETRLQAVWRQLGHLIDWCQNDTQWSQLFRAEARPYRETFYWEAVARLLAQYLEVHPAASPELALTDCLIATQCPPSADDPAAVREFHEHWQTLLAHSQHELDTAMQQDLELAEQDGVREVVARLYAADRQQWRPS